MTTTDPADRLDSWKEIASFLRRDVRTVQRWEKKEGLPVHRHHHDKLGSVYASRAEVNAWFTGREQAGAPAEAANAGKSDKIKIAVLPFSNLDGKRESDYFSDGLSEEMITQLTRLQPEQLAVIAWSTALNYNSTPNSLQQMRENLGVDYVLEGRVRRSGTRVRITARLSEVQDQTQLWAETYERDLKDLLTVQAEIAKAIAAEIHLVLKLSENERLSQIQTGQAQVKPEAYDAYLKGRYQLHKMTPDGISASVGDFEEAVELDAGYAPAWAGLASAYALMTIAPFDLVSPLQIMPGAEKAAKRALELDNTLPEAHTALALVDHHYRWKWAEAETHYKRAIELNPDYAAAHLWYSWMLLALGRREEAMRQIDETMRIVQETDPNRLVAVHATRAQAFYLGRQFEQAVQECAKGLQLDSKHFMLLYVMGRSYMRLGEKDKAIAQLEKASSPGQIPLVDAALGLAYAVTGRLEEAKKIGNSFKHLLETRYIPPTYFGMLYAGLGDRERAMAWLEKALRERADGLTWLNVDPMMDDMRKDERFMELVKKIGL